jgi:hypothetical protein
MWSDGRIQLQGDYPQLHPRVWEHHRACYSCEKISRGKIPPEEHNGVDVIIPPGLLEEKPSTSRSFFVSPFGCCLEL